MKRNLSLILLLGLGLVPFFLSAGCGDPDVADSRSPVWIDIVETSYSDGSPVGTIDVCDAVDGACGYFDEYASVSFLVQSVDPDGDIGNSPYLDVHIDHIRVSYFRTDGGENVPGTFDTYANLYLAYNITSTYPIKILHADQKLDPPLIWLNQIESFGYEPETGLGIIKGYCVIQFWGKDNSGYNVSAETRLPVQFADWAD